MTTKTADPKNPATKPHGTTDDQIKEMESEGQAQNPPPVPAADEPATSSHQDIDTAGTEADPERSVRDATFGNDDDTNVEAPDAHH